MLRPACTPGVQAGHVSLHHYAINQWRACRPGCELDDNLSAAVCGCREIFFNGLVGYPGVGNDVEVAQHRGSVDDDVECSLPGCGKYDLVKVQLDLMAAASRKSANRVSGDSRTRRLIHALRRHRRGNQSNVDCRAG